MFERLAGVWFAIIVIAAWSFFCLLMVTVTDVPRLAMAGLWLLVVGPFSWAIWRQRSM